MEITIKFDPAVDDIEKIKAALSVLRVDDQLAVDYNKMAQAIQPEQHVEVPTVTPSEETEPAEELDNEPEDAPEGEWDVNGEMWNEELHSSSKAKNADGTWKKRRGVAKAAPPSPAVITPPPPPVAATATTTPPPPDLNIGTVIRRITDKIKGHDLTMVQVNEVLKLNGLSNISDLQARPDMWDSILIQLEA
jgi:hypothetical protein